MALLMDHQFVPLPESKEVATKTFLESVSYIPPFFDCLGSKVFAPIKSDISGNITKIKAIYDSDPEKYGTLQDILTHEKGMYGADWPKAGATLALMWLKRGLRFIQLLLQSLVDGEKDENNPNLIRINITKAYEQALKRYHGWLVQKIFKGGQFIVFSSSNPSTNNRLTKRDSTTNPCNTGMDELVGGQLAALFAAPYKSDFLKALSKGQEVTEADCLEQVRQFLVNYTATIDTIYEMFISMNAELDYTV
ncbi:glycolipid transfer protein-like isoform X1 [Alosa pseudoharengus]|uniref:glycolipid transfer protein-like isoform X1 n=1 Tax=Alosa pseudoharengus TaxID=34774 RepID=UPI003F895577